MYRVPHVGFAIENIWVTALMIHHQTPDLLDSLIWLLPLLASIAMRPALARYVHECQVARHAELVLIAWGVFGAALGGAIVALSAHLASQKIMPELQLWVCAFGWTVSGTCFELVLFFVQKARDRMEKLEYPQKNISAEATAIGEVLGYTFSFLICLFYGGRSMKVRVWKYRNSSPAHVTSIQ